MNKIYLLLIAFYLTLPGAAWTAEDGEKVFLVKEYRYEPGDGSGDPVIGQSLCGTRCNALSANYLNFIEPGGWRMLKVAGNRELKVALNNPFMGGECVCVADEYLVKLDDFNRPKGIPPR